MSNGHFCMGSVVGNICCFAIDNITQFQLGPGYQKTLYTSFVQFKKPGFSLDFYLFNCMFDISIFDLKQIVV